MHRCSVATIRSAQSSLDGSINDLLKKQKKQAEELDQVVSQAAYTDHHVRELEATVFELRAELVETKRKTETDFIMSGLVEKDGEDTLKAVQEVLGNLSQEETRNVISAERVGASNNESGAEASQGSARNRRRKPRPVRVRMSSALACRRIAVLESLRSGPERRRIEVAEASGPDPRPGDPPPLEGAGI